MNQYNNEEESIPKNKNYSLEQLVKQVKADNHHEEIDYGAPIGKELI